ncbi:MAG: hypothetical protein ACRDJC_11785 [Thermomicrobiales bacterium]
MIYSGLDWSGSPGREHGPQLTFAIVHIKDSDVPGMDAELAATRRRLQLAPDYVFAHHRSGTKTQREFFTGIRHIPLTGHVYMLDKAEWAARQIGKPAGPDCLCDGIVTLVSRCPDDVVARNVLYIDLPPEEERSIERFRTEIRRALRAARPRRSGFKNVRPCPDHRLQGGIIQIADMIAGESREHGGLLGPHLPGLGSRLRLV